MRVPFSVAATIVCAACFLTPVAARADRLDEIRARGTLQWGGDTSGGAPFVFPDADDPTKIIGFEVELAEELAKELGVKAEFVQGQWDQLPALLEKGEFDVVLNGYELLPDRVERYGCCRPYYSYGLQMLARHDGPLNSLSQLESIPADGKFKIGVLSGSAAEAYMKKYAETVVTSSYSDVTSA
ncbi:MAG: substrate-binding periplasmic protein, partial [Planctomycetia bacterium]